MLSVADHEYRIGKFTGSLASQIMTVTTEAELVRIWRVKVGLEEDEPENWPMRLGAHVEPLLLDECQRQCGHPITRRGEIVDHPTIADICVKLDGYRAHDDAVIEAKFLSSFYKREDWLRFYYWQVLLQMLTTGARNGVLLVGQGTAEPVEHEIMFDQGCADALLERAQAFLVCMRTMTPPCVLPPIIPPDRWRTLDIVATPTNWSDELLTHLQTYGATALAADAHVEAGAAARALIPADVGTVYAGPFTLSRNKRGIVSIRTNTRREAA